MNGDQPGAVATFLERLGGFDRRWIFLIITLAVLVPLLAPVQLPIRATPTTRDAFEAVDAIPSGAKVVVSFEYGPSTRPEIHPMAIAILRHLFQKQVKVIVTALWPDGLFMSRDALAQVAEEEFHLTYGEDYVNLGFRPGNEAVIKGLTQSFPANYTLDAGGIQTVDIPIMQGVESLRDVAFIFSLSAGYPGTVEWVQYAADPLDIPMSTGTTSIQVNEVLPYVKAGQVRGILAGMPGAAEYEALLGQTGQATQFMDAQSFAHLVIVIFIILGNITYTIQRRRARRERPWAGAGGAGGAGAR